MLEDILGAKWVPSDQGNYVKFYETLNTDYALISGTIVKQDDGYFCKVMKVVDSSNPEAAKLNRLDIEEFGTLSDAMSFCDSKGA